jgi:hypothetical protein
MSFRLTIEYNEPSNIKCSIGFCIESTDDLIQHLNGIRKIFLDQKPVNIYLTCPGKIYKFIPKDVFDIWNGTKSNMLSISILDRIVLDIVE